MGTIQSVTWGFVWLMLALEIPLITLIVIVWWAIKKRPEEPPASEEGGGGGASFAIPMRQSRLPGFPDAAPTAARHLLLPPEYARSARGHAASSTERGADADAWPER